MSACGSGSLHFDMQDAYLVVVAMLYRYMQDTYLRDVHCCGEGALDDHPGVGWWWEGYLQDDQRSRLLNCMARTEFPSAFGFGSYVSDGSMKIGYYTLNPT